MVETVHISTRFFPPSLSLSFSSLVACSWFGHAAPSLVSLGSLAPPVSWPAAHAQYIYSHRAYDQLRRKKWFFLADDSTWVNVPALLETVARRYSHECAVVFGFVWNRVWVESIDYLRSGSGAEGCCAALRCRTLRCGAVPCAVLRCSPSLA